jgi:hypothetical protein
MSSRNYTVSTQLGADTKEDKENNGRHNAISKVHFQAHDLLLPLSIAKGQLLIYYTPQCISSFFSVPFLASSIESNRQNREDHHELKGLVPLKFHMLNME